jgi:3-hydroxyisobutyrate dehydrogenase-like beta-hydroxyacid dehydrogenase
MNIGFIGLGVMGNPMAQNLQRSGQHQLNVFDIDPARGEILCASGARSATDVADAVRDADVVMTSLPGPKQIEEVALGDNGFVARMKSGAAWIDLSTNNLAVAKKIRVSAQTFAIDILDAPVSGGDEGARAGNLTILVGGDRAVFEGYLSLLEIIGERVSLLGDHGAGYSAKIAQVVLCYLHSLALSEALMLGVKGGVDPQQMLDIIQNSTGRSYVADRYGPPILNGDYDPSFTVGLAHKDMKLAAEMAASLGIRLPMCDLTTATYARAMETYGFDANHLRAVRLLEEDNNTFLQA